MADYYIDPERGAATPTGIMVRACEVIDGCKAWGSHDIAYLTRDSVLEFLRSRGGQNEWMENVILLVMRYK